MNGFDQFEALAEQLVEGTFERLFRPCLHPSEVARRLARAMEDGLIVADDGRVLFPNQYWVLLNPDDLAALDVGSEALQTELARYLERLAAERDVRFDGRLRVALHPIANLGTGQLDVRAAHLSEPGDTDDTQAVKVAGRSAADASRWALHLGERVFALGEPVVRLGRALSNDLILDDRRVSRRHAQLRWRAGRYHLSDIGSRGGTKLNDHTLNTGEEFPLSSSDVINLAGVTLTVRVEREQPAVEVTPTSTLPPGNR